MRKQFAYGRSSAVPSVSNKSTARHAREREIFHRLRVVHHGVLVRRGLGQRPDHHRLELVPRALHSVLDLKLPSELHGVFRQTVGVREPRLHLLQPAQRVAQPLEVKELVGDVPVFGVARELEALPRVREIRAMARLCHPWAPVRPPHCAKGVQVRVDVAQLALVQAAADAPGDVVAPARAGSFDEVHALHQTRPADIASDPFEHVVPRSTLSACSRL